jgi:hypothetical protein
MRRTSAVVLLLLTLTACGGSSENANSSATATSTPTSNPSPSTTSEVVASANPAPLAPVDDLGVIAKAMQKSLPDVVDTVVMTENNDVNNLIGRPGQYDAGVFLASKAMGCTSDYNELDTACGAKLERWPTPAAAKARMKDIQKKLRTYGLGAEWDYLGGRVLLRVSGDIKPSLATKYETAFHAASNTTPSTVDPQTALKDAVQAYSDAYLSGNGDAAYTLLSRRCQDRWSKSDFSDLVEQAGQQYGSPLHVTSFNADIAGDLARVTYTFTVAAINQNAEPWVRENGDWHEDDC